MRSEDAKYWSQMQEGEVWLGNHDVRGGVNLPAHLATLKTARLGQLAYDIKGKEIKTDYCLPLFIHQSEAEAYDRIMMDRLKAIRRGF